MYIMGGTVEWGGGVRVSESEIVRDFWSQITLHNIIIILNPYYVKLTE
jgi:hypothetical protein